MSFVGITGVLALELLSANAAGAVSSPPGGTVASVGAPSPRMPRYTHIFIIVAENKGYDLIIGPGTAAPNIDSLARRYGLATQFFAEVHPSEGNYIAMLAGD